MQLFIVATKLTHICQQPGGTFCFNADERFLRFMMYADKENRKITNLYEFTENFLPKCTLES
jgi:type I restriction enzyme R subunit